MKKRIVVSIMIAGMLCMTACGGNASEAAVSHSETDAGQGQNDKEDEKLEIEIHNMDAGQAGAEAVAETEGKDTEAQILEGEEPQAEVTQEEEEARKKQEETAVPGNDTEVIPVDEAVQPQDSPSSEPSAQELALQGHNIPPDANVVYEDNGSIYVYNDEIEFIIVTHDQIFKYIHAEGDRYSAYHFTAEDCLMVIDGDEALFFSGCSDGEYETDVGLVGVYEKNEWKSEWEGYAWYPTVEEAYKAFREGL